MAGFLHQSVDAMDVDAVDLKVATEQALSISLGHDVVVVVATWLHFVN